MNTNFTNEPVLVIGAGIMGAGIAQVAAQAGHPVFLFDLREGAADKTKEKLEATLKGLVSKGRLDAQAAQTTLARIQPVAALEDARSARLVVEAIVENLQAKRSLFQQLEAVVDAETILATNTSSISVTAIANGLKHPGRLVGMHFFNPVPLMRLVEVVSGLQTQPEVAQAIFSLSQAWGKVPVHARSTPGFIVNRIARPYYAETLALLQEQAARPEALDLCMKAVGFRMGPCELMDLIGHDTNFAVTQSVYEANFYDKRYVPSLVQREMVDGGLLGRKSGQGFYHYPSGMPAWTPPPVEALDPSAQVVIHGSGPIADHLADHLANRLTDQLKKSPGQSFKRDTTSAWVGLAIDDARLILSDGRTATEWAASIKTKDVAVIDRFIAVPIGDKPEQTPLAYATAAGSSPAWQSQAPAWLTALGFQPVELTDTPGLIVTRTLAMLINEAADAITQGVCSPDAADTAMKLGVNYPQGPFEWLEAWSVPEVVCVLEALDAYYRGERYRVSPWLRRHQH
jgi:3-hydroxybutyryl-CoA dehydrogenase